MQKVSAWGIAGCAVVIGVIQYVSNPEMIHGTLANPVGLKIMTVGGALILIGLVWMRRLAWRI
jgi:Flp pilus assembly protein TadB